MRVATIGTGGIARAHLNALSSLPELEIVGHVTKASDGARQAAERWGGRAYSDFREMLDRERPDAVWVCVPPGAHGEIERELLDRRLPFFVEKPLSADATTAEELAAAVQRAGVVVGVGYHWRAMDTIPEVRQALAENPARMVLGAWHDATPPPEWWKHQATSGGQVVEQATHLFDIARSLIGEAAVTAATASRHERPAHPDMDVADVSAALLRYDSGVTGVFSATCLLGGPAAIHVQLVCEGLLITITGARVTYTTAAGVHETTTANNPFLDEDRAFLDAVREQDPARLYCSYADALGTHRLCCEVRRAAGDEGRGMSDE